MEISFPDQSFPKSDFITLSTYELEFCYDHSCLAEKMTFLGYEAIQGMNKMLEFQMEMCKACVK